MQEEQLQKTQPLAFGICSLSYTGPKLWNSLTIDVKKIKQFSSFCRYVKNSVIDGYNTIIDF